MRRTPRCHEDPLNPLHRIPFHVIHAACLGHLLVLRLAERGHRVAEDRQLQQARLVEVRGGPRVVRPRREPRAQGQGRSRLPVLRRPQGARRLQRPGNHPSRHSRHVAPAHERCLEADRRDGDQRQAGMVAGPLRPRVQDVRQEPSDRPPRLLPLLLRKEKAREADKDGLAERPSRGEGGQTLLLSEYGVLLPIVVVWGIRARRWFGAVGQPKDRRGWASD